MCFHKFVRGSGIMADGLTCEKCGYSKYPELIVFLLLYELLGRVRDLKEGESFYNEFPFIRKEI
jgi:hypothetical protein